MAAELDPVPFAGQCAGVGSLAPFDGHRQSDIRPFTRCEQQSFRIIGIRNYLASFGYHTALDGINFDWLLQ